MSERRLGAWTVGARLGQGGMGVVYEAVRPDGRRAALKVLPREAAGDERARTRLLREIAALSKLRHPGIVPLLDSGFAEDGSPFYVMELLPGPSLETLVRTGAPREELLRHVVAVARAVEHAHAAGIVHRDLKPANVLLGFDARPRLVDFGLVRDLGGDLRTLTRSGQWVGTLAYMAPEQVAAREVGPATDVWALGAVLYEVLTGFAPFDGGSLDVASKIMEEEPSPPSRRTAGVPAAFDPVVARAMQKEPGERWPGAAAFADALQAALDRSAAATLHDGAAAAPARTGLLAVLGAAALLAAGAVGVGIGWRWRPTPGSPPRAPADPVAAVASAGPTATAAPVATTSAPAGGEDVEAAEALLDRGDRPGAAARARRAASGGALAPEACLRLADVLRRTGHAAEAVDLLEPRVAAGAGPELLVALGRARLAAGDVDGALWAAGEALAFESTVGGWCLQAEALLARRSPEAHAEALQVLEDVRREAPDAARVRLLLARAHRLGQAPALALEELDAARRLAPRDPEVCLELGRLAVATGEVVAAVEWLRQAAAGLDGPEAGLELAELLLATDRADEARRTLEALARAWPDDPRVREAVR